MSPESSPPTDQPDSTIWPYIGVGCLTAVVGFFGGGMIAMLIGKVVDTFTGCKAAEGLPVCEWWRYWWTGGLIGFVGLPFIAVRRMRRGRKMADSSNESR